MEMALSGIRVNEWEGITNTLMTVLMALLISIIKNKILSVLVVQVLGIPIIIFVAWITFLLQKKIFGENNFNLSNLLMLFGYIFLLSFYFLGDEWHGNRAAYFINYIGCIFCH